MLKINPPENFEFTKPQLWPEWKQRFTRYRIATKLNKEDDEIQISALIYSMGKQAEPGFINADSMQENPSKRSSVAYTNWQRTVILRMHEMNKFEIV